MNDELLLNVKSGRMNIWSGHVLKNNTSLLLGLIVDYTRLPAKKLTVNSGKPELKGQKNGK